MTDKRLAKCEQNYGVWKMQDWKMTDKRLAKCEQNYGVWKMQDWKMTDKLLSGCWFHYGQALVKRMTKIGLKDAYLHDESATDVVRCLLGLPLLPPTDMISSPHYRISASPLLPTDHTAVSFSNWWRTPSVSGLTGVLSVQIGSVFVTIRRGRTTYSKVTILACVGEFKLATRTCSAS